MVVGFIPKQLREDKFSPTGQWLCFLGMSANHKGWTLIHPLTGTETTVRTAQFHDTLMLHDWKIQHQHEPDVLDAQTFDIEIEQTPESDFDPPLSPQHANQPPPSAREDSLEEAPPLPRRSARLATTVGTSSGGITSSPNSTYYSDLLSKQHEDQSVFLTTHMNTQELSVNLHSSSLKALLMTANTSLPPEPSTVKEALSGPHAEEWKKNNGH